mmetsp:Transcript_39481/g.63154  ORF Transcript_39481/g.63154 Transcript_39481/m.63154 type:complete len:256 (-) Transcript_39481:180-947(-)
MSSKQSFDEISYEFNTGGFYNILSNQLIENQSVLIAVSRNAADRLEIKRGEYVKIIPPTSENQQQMKDSSPCKMQVIRFHDDESEHPDMDDVDEEEEDEEEKQEEEAAENGCDWSKYQLSKLYTLNNHKNEARNAPKISPIASFINMDPFRSLSVQNKQIKDIQPPKCKAIAPPPFNETVVDTDTAAQQKKTDRIMDSAACTKIQSAVIRANPETKSPTKECKPSLSASQVFAVQSSGDHVVDSLLMKLSAHMTI